MERKVGEIFECDGVKLRVENDKEKNDCYGCYFFNSNCITPLPIRGQCRASNRSDGKGVIFELDSEESGKQSILDESQEILRGSRQSDYGDAANNFERIATIVNSVYPDLMINAEQCCMVLIAVKLIREGFNHKRDNLVDLCGYAHIMNEIKESEKKGE